MAIEEKSELPHLMMMSASRKLASDVNRFLGLHTTMAPKNRMLIQFPFL